MSSRPIDCESVSQPVATTAPTSRAANLKTWHRRIAIHDRRNILDRSKFVRPTPRHRSRCLVLADFHDREEQRMPATISSQELGKRARRTTTTVMATLRLAVLGRFSMSLETKVQGTVVLRKRLGFQGVTPGGVPTFGCRAKRGDTHSTLLALEREQILSSHASISLSL